MRTDYQEIKVRKKLREKYFEDPKYNQLSHIIDSTFDRDNYGGRRDNLAVASCVVGWEIMANHKLTVDKLLAHQDDPRVNWTAIYQYVDERLNDKDGKWKDELIDYKYPLPIPIKKFLDDYRHLLLPPEFDMI